MAREDKGLPGTKVGRGLRAVGAGLRRMGRTLTGGPVNTQQELREHNARMRRIGNTKDIVPVERNRTRRDVPPSRISSARAVREGVGRMGRTLTGGPSNTLNERRRHQINTGGDVVKNPLALTGPIGRRAEEGSQPTRNPARRNEALTGGSNPIIDTRQGRHPMQPGTVQTVRPNRQNSASTGASTKTVVDNGRSLNERTAARQARVDAIRAKGANLQKLPVVSTKPSTLEQRIRKLPTADLPGGQAQAAASSRAKGVRRAQAGISDELRAAQARAQANIDARNAAAGRRIR